MLIINKTKMTKMTIMGMWKSENGIIINITYANNHAFKGYLELPFDQFSNSLSRVDITGIVNTNLEQSTRVSFFSHSSDSYPNTIAFFCEIYPGEVSVMSTKWVMYQSLSENKIISDGMDELTKVT